MIELSRECLSKLNKPEFVKYSGGDYILKAGGDGYVYFDGDNLVGYVFVCDKFVCPLFVNPQYRGHGLSRQMLTDAISDFDASYLWCSTHKTIAFNLYKSSGFRVDELESDDEYYKMYRTK